MADLWLIQIFAQIQQKEKVNHVIQVNQIKSSKSSQSSQLQVKNKEKIELWASAFMYNVNGWGCKVSIDW